MNRTTRAALVCVFTLGALAPLSSQDGKTSLRYAFKKGDKFPLSLTHSISVKIDKVPELLQGILSDDPINVKFEGTVDMEVNDVDAAGTAVLTGTWRLAKAKGHVMVNDIDFDYDSSKKQPPRPKKKEKEDLEDQALQALGDLQDSLDRMVHLALKLSVDSTGMVTVMEGSGKVGQIETALRSLNGVMGALPKEKVGKGDTWKEDIKLSLPGMAAQMELKLSTVNTLDSIGPVDGVETAVIKSKFVMADAGGKKTEPAPAAVEAKIKTDGGGDGTTVFSVTAGRARQSKSSMRIKIAATIPNPGGGEEMDMKALMKIDATLELGSK